MDGGSLDFLNNYIDDNVAGYYTKIWELNGLAQAPSPERVNVFAVICSYTMPKSVVKGSHAYSVTFSLVDPSITLSTSVPFVWFCNSLNNLHMNFKVGDIIRIEGARLQNFNNYPQLVGKDNEVSVTIFHRTENFLTALPTCPLTIVPPYTDPGAAADEEDEDRASSKAEAGVRQPYMDPAWTVTHLGVVSISKSKLSKKERMAQAPVSSDRPPMMWPQEIHKLIYLSAWVDQYFSTHSFADSSQVATQHVTLHALQQYLYSTVNAQDYASLVPAAQPSSSGQHPSVPMQNGNNKCDLVCLVMNVILPAANVDGLARMTVWDGTTNGMYTPSMTVGKTIQIALDAPAIYDTADDHKYYQDQRQTAVHASATASSSASAALARSQLEIQLADLQGRAYSVRKYAGSAVKVQAADASLNQHILRCKAGMWIRIRNLYALPAPQGGGEQGGAHAARACVRADSHVCSLSPKYLDVRHIVRVYLNRMTHLLVRNVQASLAPTTAPANTLTTAPTASTESGVVGQSSGAAQPVVPTGPTGPPQVFSDEPPTFIGVLKSGPAPAKYCLRARVESWWPSNIDDFVTRETNEGGKEESVLQFALTVADPSGSAQILLRGDEAERYLAITSADLQAHPAAREVVRVKLEALRAQKIVSEFKVRVFVDKHTVPLPMQPEVKRPRGGSRRAADPPQLTYVRKTKRIIVFDTVAGITLDATSPV